MSRSPLNLRFPAARTLTTAALLLTVVATSQRSLAGPIFVPGHLDEGRFVAPAEPVSSATDPAEGFGYEIRYATIDAHVARSGTTTVTVEETILGPTTAVRTVCIVPLPIGVDGDSVRLAAGPNAKSREPLEGVRILEPEAARTLLEGLVCTTGDVGFAALLGRPVAVVDAFELAGRTSFRIAYSQPRADADGATRDGVVRLVLPLPKTQWANAPVEQLSITTSIAAAGEPLRAIFSPSHRTTVERASLFEAVARVRSNDVLCEDDYRLVWAEEADDLGLRLLPFRLDGEDDGYFALVANPTGRRDGTDELPKDVTFVLDTSGSMRGEKIEQCRAAIAYCLDQLGSDDRFNIVTFGTDVQPFRRGLVPNTAKNLEAARDFVDEIVALGRTNIDGALRAALAGEATEGRPRITIFLTDGTPTAGELVPDRILEAATKANVSNSSVYVLGVGHDVNVHLLDRLAESTEGSAEFVEPEEEIDSKVAGLYDRLAHPVLTDVAVRFDDLDTHSLFPRKLPAMYRNSQVMLFGRYREGGPSTVTVSGTLAGKKKVYTLDFTAPNEPAGSANDFVAPLWATRKIGYLLQEMRLHGEDAELLEEIVRLSKKYGIVTEYTQFVAMRSGFAPGGDVALAMGGGGGAFGGAAQLGAQLNAPIGDFRDQGRVAGLAGREVQFERLNQNALEADWAKRGGGVANNAPAAGAPLAPLDEATAVAEVTRQIALARKQETGRWAFNQAMNDKDLQSRVVATGVANSYTDRRGNTVALDAFVKHVGGRCFYLNNGQWCEAEEPGDRKERVVELYGDEYFRLVRENDDFRRAQKLGWALSINVGDERVVVEKAGKRSDLAVEPQPASESVESVEPRP